jgi:hypothetical protein
MIKPGSEPLAPGPSKASDVFIEIFKLVPPTAGIMIALIWGLANRATPPTHTVLLTIRTSSILLVASMLISFYGLAVSADALRNNEEVWSRTGTKISLVLASAFFSGGAVSVIYGLF